MMGCVSSKEFSATSSWCFRLPSHSHRQSHHAADDDIESRHIVSLTSTSYGLLNTDGSSSSQQGSFLSFQAKSKRPAAAATCSDFVLSPGLDTKHLAACARMAVAAQPMKKESNEEASLLLSNTGHTHAMETINTWELMDGLEEGCRGMQLLTATGYGASKLRMSKYKPRSFDFTTAHALTNISKHASYDLSDGSHAYDALLPESDTLPIKYYPQSEMVKDGSFFCQGSPQHAPSSPSNGSPRGAPFCGSPRKPPSCSSLAELDDPNSASLGGPASRGFSGLKLLLNPIDSLSYYTTPLTKKARLRSASSSFDSNAENLQKKSHESPGTKKRWSRQQSMDSSKGSDAQLFDPSLIATFEKAVEATSQFLNDDWLQQSMDENTTNSSSSDNTWPSSEMASDAESGPHWPKQEKMPYGIKMPSLKEEDKQSKAPLHFYEVRCPPQGADKVVLYYTSMRGVRKTYEDCCTIRLILKGLGVHVEERDVWMHSQFKEELRNVLGDILKGVALVPQLFIKGRYIGGAEEVKRLHEDAMLVRLMDGIAMDTECNVCDGCGDVRFIPCLTCNGSCKVRNHHGKVLRCPVCNENGLIMCPICSRA